MLSTDNFVLVALYGATGVGKTAVALRLGECLQCPIISSDSRQCYREMSIGTARPTPQEMLRVKHYFVATHSIEERFSAGQFEVDALQRIHELRNTNTTAILTGGSMLYMDALTQGIDAFPAPDMNLRASLTEQLAREGVTPLFLRLEELDPTTAKRIDRYNRARVLRALEVSLQTGRPYSSWLEKSKTLRTFALISVGIQRTKENLHQRINQRVDSMLEAGLLKEVESLLPYRHLPALQTVGYIELFDYFDGKDTLEQAIEKIKLHTRQYAKRQMQWWKRNPNIVWFDAEDYDTLYAFVSKSLSKNIIPNAKNEKE